MNLSANVIVFAFLTACITSDLAYGQPTVSSETQEKKTQCLIRKSELRENILRELTKDKRKHIL